MDYDRLKALFEKQEVFPHDFTVKFIGRNTPLFLGGVRDFESDFPSLRKQAERLSSGQANLALTYLFSAKNADEIIAVLKRASQIPDVQVVL
jgi:putative lipoic acid-binding regulatory protein